MATHVSSKQASLCAVHKNHMRRIRKHSLCQTAGEGHNYGLLYDVMEIHKYTVGARHICSLCCIRYPYDCTCTIQYTGIQEDGCNYKGIVTIFSTETEYNPVKTSRSVFWHTKFETESWVFENLFYFCLDDCQIWHWKIFVSLNILRTNIWK
jgi:hypothetical protein